MQKKNRCLTLLILLFLTLSACSEDQETGPSLIEISSDEDIKPDEEEDSDEEEGSDEEEIQFIPPELPDLPDPALSSSQWNQVNGPFG